MAGIHPSVNIIAACVTLMIDKKLVATAVLAPSQEPPSCTGYRFTQQSACLSAGRQAGVLHAHSARDGKGAGRVAGGV
jgi:hypothetical protein